MGKSIQAAFDWEVYIVDWSKVSVNCIKACCISRNSCHVHIIVANLLRGRLLGYNHLAAGCSIQPDPVSIDQQIQVLTSTVSTVRFSVRRALGFHTMMHYSLARVGFEDLAVTPELTAELSEIQRHWATMLFTLSCGLQAKSFFATSKLLCLILMWVPSAALTARGKPGACWNAWVLSIF